MQNTSFKPFLVERIHATCQNFGPILPQTVQFVARRISTDPHLMIQMIIVLFGGCLGYRGKLQICVVLFAHVLVNQIGTVFVVLVMVGVLVQSHFGL